MPSFQSEGEFSSKKEESRSHLSNDRRKRQWKGVGGVPESVSADVRAGRILSALPGSPQQTTREKVDVQRLSTLLKLSPLCYFISTEMLEV